MFANSLHHAESADVSADVRSRVGAAADRFSGRCRPRAAPGPARRSDRHRWSNVAGSLTRISESGVAIDVEGTTIDRPANGIAQISRRGDSLINGLGIGIGAGLAAGLAVAAVFSGSETGEGLEDTLVSSLPLCVGAGAGVGLLFDWIFEGRTLVYRAVPARVSMLPIVTPTHTGMVLRVNF